MCGAWLIVALNTKPVHDMTENLSSRVNRTDTTLNKYSYHASGLIFQHDIKFSFRGLCFHQLPFLSAYYPGKMDLSAMFWNFNETILQQASVELRDAVCITQRWRKLDLDCKINRFDVPVMNLIKLWHVTYKVANFNNTFNDTYYDPGYTLSSFLICLLEYVLVIMKLSVL